MKSFRKLVAGRTRSGVPRNLLEVDHGAGCVQYECFDYEGSRQVLARVVETTTGWTELSTLEITMREYQRLIKPNDRRGTR